MEQLNLSYEVPITIVETTVDTTEGSRESISQDFVIRGIAINSTVTDNNHKFLSEELKSSVSSLMGRPLLIDHNDSIMSIAGKVIKANFNDVNENIEFEAKLNNTEVGKIARELIKSGDLSTVSVGAAVKELSEEDGMLIPKGIKFKELSLVATPADDGAMFTFRGNTLDMALQMAWKDSKKQSENDLVVDNKLNTEKETMNIEESKTVEENEVTKEETQVTESPETVDYSDKFEKIESKFKAQSEVLAEVLSTLKELKEAKTEEKSKEKVEEKVELKESDVDEAPSEEPEAEEPKEEKTEEEELDLDEESEEEEVEEVSENGDYRILSGHRYFTIEKVKYK